MIGKLLIPVAIGGGLPPELVPLFDKHRRSFKGSLRRSGTEQFLEWAEENPDEVPAVQQREADEALNKLLRGERLSTRRRTRRLHQSKGEELRRLPHGVRS